MQLVVNGILTNYEKLGNEKEILLILHGWQRSLSEWLPTAKQLSDRYTVYVIDLPGFGQTLRPNETYSVYDYATFVVSFLEKLTIKKCSLLGHSFGGRIGIILGAKTEILNKLILVDAAGVEKRNLIVKSKIQTFKFAKHLLPKNLKVKLQNKFGSTDYVSSGTMRDIFLNTINEDLTYLLPKIKPQTALIWGEKDVEIPYWKIQLMKKLIPNAFFYVIWGAGHSPHLEKFKEFMQILEITL